MNLFFVKTIHPVNRERLNASKPESVLEAITLVPHMPSVGIELCSYTILQVRCGAGKGAVSPVHCNVNMGGGKSFADDLNGNRVL